MTAQAFDTRACDLGEGPLWHPLRKELFWFDITGRRMLSRKETQTQEWQFEEMHSAAGWIDSDTLLLASETGLWRFDLGNGTRNLICHLEKDNVVTRSNDGRADPQGGFWIGTMGKKAETGAGSIWRWYRGTLRQLFTSITIPNAISFAPDGKSACFCDTVSKQVMRVALDAEGWPAGKPEMYLDLVAEGLNPDGAVIDATGAIWIAQWGAARAACYGADGAFIRAIDVPAPHASCPAFGGPDLQTIFVTTARQGMTPEQHIAAPHSGQTFMAPSGVRGQAEHQVLID
ncbi:sugar lactone lactonase YvrE [Sulfitobacter undariae]|uniref:Sugar lactone lactonase YvrE n=1 Tax=Sulfitobacter undariae TaxID=1563671 RepID=A0A7W6EB00_9RHOB|nr:SMP-30/gluconolactonase/LRE family protein [Sulfitobacter undariae]MBB3995892.1 sugar lactone lactonase YvrE [Sulfitobacter undariae]